MNNRGNIFKDWIKVLVVILCISNIINVRALELEENISTEDNLFNNSEEVIIDEVIIDNNIVEDTITNEEVEFTREDILTNNSINMEFKENVVVIKGNIGELITVKEVLANINMQELNNYYFLTKVGIINDDGIWLEEDEVVTNSCSIIFVGNEFIGSYKISFLGDLNQDNIVNEEDIKDGIEEFFKEEIDEVIDNEEIIIDTDVKNEVIIDSDKNEDITKEDNTITEDISYVDAVVKNNTYEVEVPNEEEVLNVTLESINDDEIYVEEKVDVTLKIDGFNYNYINTISGYVEYDKDVLELENIYIIVNGGVIGKFDNNKFIYILDNYNRNDVFLIIEFKSLKSGVTDIYIDDLKLIMNGIPIKLVNNTNLNITINEYGKGGDSESIIDTNNNNNNNNSSINSKPINQNKPNKQNNNSTKRPNYINNVVKNEPNSQLSNDTYIKNIEISGYEIAFDKDTYYYKIEVDNSVESLDFNITLNDSKSSYIITGNEQFKTGKNEIIITVKAQNGDKKDYVIEVNKKNKDDIKEEKVKEIKHEKYHMVIIIVMIVVTLILIYRLLKTDD